MTPSPSSTRRVKWLAAAALAKRLEASGALVEYRDYADVEHMVIVQAALDDVFRFLDAAAAAQR